MHVIFIQTAREIRDYVFKYCSQNDNIIPSELVEILNDVIDEEFDTICEDNSVNGELNGICALNSPVNIKNVHASHKFGKFGKKMEKNSRFHILLDLSIFSLTNKIEIGKIKKKPTKSEKTEIFSENESKNPQNGNFLKKYVEKEKYRKTEKIQ